MEDSHIQDESSRPTVPSDAPNVGGAGKGPNLVGKDIDGFHVISEIGRGGMGVVYRAHDPKLDRTVALKVLPPHLAADPDFTDRFLREARSSARLDHPNVVPVFSMGLTEEACYISMLHVEGDTLADHMAAADGPLPVAEALNIARQVASALGAAHDMGIVHRDVKPSNIMLTVGGGVKVMDFGLSRSMLSGSRITQTGIYLGTPEYSSPEQCETTELDGRSDIYSLGVVLYEMLSGAIPHSGDTPLALFKKIVEEEPVSVRQRNPEVSPSVEALVRRMMAKGPAKRPNSASAVVAEIDRILGRPVSSETRDTLVLAGSRRSSRIGWILLGTVAAALVVAALLAQRPDQGGDVGPQPVVVGPPVVPERRTVVPRPLPTVIFDFHNGSGDMEAEWLGVGLPELLAADLRGSRWFDPISRQKLLARMRRSLGRRVQWMGDSMEENKDVSINSDTLAVAETLGARVMLAGTFYVLGDQIRVLGYVYAHDPDAAGEVILVDQISVVRPKDEVMEIVSDLAAGFDKVLQTNGADVAPAVPETSLAFGTEDLKDASSLGALVFLETSEDAGMKRSQRQAEGIMDPDAPESVVELHRRLGEAGPPGAPRKLGKKLDAAWDAEEEERSVSELDAGAPVESVREDLARARESAETSAHDEFLGGVRVQKDGEIAGETHDRLRREDEKTVTDRPNGRVGSKHGATASPMESVPGDEVPAAGYIAQQQVLRKVHLGAAKADVDFESLARKFRGQMKQEMDEDLRCREIFLKQQVLHALLGQEEFRVQVEDLLQRCRELRQLVPAGATENAK